MKPLRRALLVIACLVPGLACAPEPPRHLFYLHGQIVEGSEGEPVHPRLGVYRYPAIVEAFENEGFVVHSEIRPAATDGEAYAHRVAAEILGMRAAGVPLDSICVVGASKGGGIAVAVSSLLAEQAPRFVLLGTCVSWIESWPELRLRGHLLSISDVDDAIAGSCAAAFSESDIEPRFEELRIESGRGHGAFYEPLDAWFAPTVAWCAETHAD